jgi:glycerol-3-phosphate dehydrogenase
MQEIPVERAMVVGGGAFGTALALILARKGALVHVWVRDKAQAEHVNAARENVKYLSGTKLPDNLLFTADVTGSLSALGQVDLVIFAIPTQFLRSFLEAHRSTFPVGVPLIQSAKGIEVGTLKTPFEIMQDELPGKYSKWLCVLAGPSFAKEMAAGLVTNVTIAAPDPLICEKVTRQMSCRAASFRCYSNDDVMGCEIAGAVKNVLAIASGASSGLGLGLNARAGLICRGLHEMSLLARAAGSNTHAMSGLAGVGDLLLTCSSELSRNFTVGLRLAKGETLEAIIKSTTTVAEGVATAKALFELSKSLGVELPISSQVYEVLYLNKPVGEALMYLQDRPLSKEH